MLLELFRASLHPKVGALFFQFSIFSDLPGKIGEGLGEKGTRGRDTART